MLYIYLEFSFFLKINAFLAGKDRQDQRLRPSEYFVCGMFTGAVAALVEGPIDLVRIEFLLLFPGVSTEWCGFSPLSQIEI